jgi:predicted alpha/beta-hydrolase family hydrolase
MMKKKIAIICGREQLSADVDFQVRFSALLVAMSFDVIHEPSSGQSISQQGFLFSLVKKVVFGLRINYLFRWALRIFNRHQSQASVTWRINQLRAMLRAMDLTEAEVYLIGRSAGALVASHLAIEFPVKAVIALGYPFIHPKHGVQQHRIQHLPHMHIPMYILQGIYDEYGTTRQIAKIPMSDFVQVCYLDTDHNFVLDQSEWGRFELLIQRYLA